MNERGTTAETLRRSLRRQVLSGEIPVGERLDSERRLAAEYRLPRSAVARVFAEMEQEGLVSRQVGRGGTVVISNRPVRAVSGPKQITCLLTHFRDFSPVDNYFYDIIHGAQQAARDRGCALGLWSPSGSGSFELLRSNALDSFGPVVLVDEEFGDDIVESLCRQYVRPIVLNRRSHLPVDTVLADNADGMGQAVDHLYRLGHRRGGYVGDLLDPNNVEREGGFLDRTIGLGLDQAGHLLSLSVDTRALNRAGVRNEEIDVLQVRQITDEFISRHTAVVCSNDYIANAVCRKARAMNRAVPGDLSVVGFCDFALASQMAPKLTSVHIDSRRIGRQAVERFFERLDGGDDEPRTLRIPVDLRVRESTNQREGP